MSFDFPRWRDSGRVCELINLLFPPGSRLENRRSHLLEEHRHPPGPAVCSLAWLSARSLWLFYIPLSRSRSRSRSRSLSLALSISISISLSLSRSLYLPLSLSRSLSLCRSRSRSLAPSLSLWSNALHVGFSKFLSQCLRTALQGCSSPFAASSILQMPSKKSGAVLDRCFAVAPNLWATQGKLVSSRGHAQSSPLSCAREWPPPCYGIWGPDAVAGRGANT